MKQEIKKTIDPATVDRIAELSRLFLSDEEKAEIFRDMETILAFAGRIAEIEDGATETTRRSASLSELREDEPASSLPPEDLLRAAPLRRDGYVVVPSVMEE